MNSCAVMGLDAKTAFHFEDRDMKIKLVKFDTIYTPNYYGIEISEVYDVLMDCGDGRVVIMDGTSKPLVIHHGEFEVVA